MTLAPYSQLKCRAFGETLVRIYLKVVALFDQSLNLRPTNSVANW